MKTIDFLIIGPLVGLDLIFAEYLSRLGYKCVVARKISSRAEQKEDFDELSIFHQEFSPDSIVWFRSSLELLSLLRRAKLVATFGGTLIGYVKLLWIFRKPLGFPPVVYWHTGSDIIERAIERSIKGFALRYFLSTVDVNLGLAYPDAQRIYNCLNVPRLKYWHFPYLLFEESGKGNQPKNEILRLFHPSHIDFKVNNPGEDRKSSKGNDQFIRAYARALKKGINAKCVMLERGADVGPAKELISKLGIDGKVEWLPHLTRDELFHQFQLANLIVDQFDVGALGGIAMEAMSVGKPVLTWVDENAASVSYSDPPPVLNASNEEEIYNQLLLANDRDLLEEKGSLAKDWVHRNHDWRTCLKPFVDYFESVTNTYQTT